MIGFIGSVFSPYYHWSGRRHPENHVAFNIALYTPEGNYWAMTERGADALVRDGHSLAIGRSGMALDAAGRLTIRFEEMALPWPGQRLLPRTIAGTIAIDPLSPAGAPVKLDAEGNHVWAARIPAGRAQIACENLANGGWRGRGYHDWNWGARPLETDFLGWDWARGETAGTGEALIFYDALLRDGGRRRFGLKVAQGGGASDSVPGPEPIAMPASQPLARGFWGVRGAVACDAAARPVVRRRLEDTPFYTRSLVDVVLAGHPARLVHETLDCRRLAHPLVRMMLPFRMPRRPR